MGRPAALVGRLPGSGMSELTNGVTAVVTCMTDGERPYLGAAIASVQAQTSPARLLLCVAEGNDWVDQVLDSVRSGVEVIRLPLGTAAATRNRAVAAARTELIAFLDGDDVWHPRKLEEQVDALTVRSWEVVASKHILIREDGKPYFFGFAKEIPMTSSWLGRTECFRQRPFPDIAIGEDVQLWKTLVEQVPTGTLDRFLLRYRVRASSLSEQTPSKRRKLAYERRSRIPGGRPLLLAASYAANVGMRARAAAGR
jgi:glycosyltransferase involved in cell wall biosynthesis